MVTYEVTAAVDAELVSAYEHFMRTRHIPDLLATGYFTGATFSRSESGRYRIRYEVPDHAKLEEYLAHHAPRLRAHLEEVFPKGVRITREIWTVLGAFPGP